MEKEVSGKIVVSEDDWVFIPNSINSLPKLEKDIEFLTKVNPAHGTVFLQKLPNFLACGDFLRKAEYKKYAKCVSGMRKI